MCLTSSKFCKAVPSEDIRVVFLELTVLSREGMRCRGAKVPGCQPGISGPQLTPCSSHCTHKLQSGQIFLSDWLVFLRFLCGELCKACKTDPNRSHGCGSQGQRMDTMHAVPLHWALACKPRLKLETKLIMSLICWWGPWISASHFLHQQKSGSWVAWSGTFWGKACYQSG